MNTIEPFLIALAVIYSVPYLVWRMLRTDYYAPLVVVQIIAGVLLGPSVLGKLYPDHYAHIFSPPVIQSLNGIAWWSVMIFVWIAGIELDLQQSWRYRRESAITAGLALTVPLLFGSGVAAGMLAYDGWIGNKAQPWQFVLGIGMACAVTALPILILLMEKLAIIRQPLGQRILRYASLDDIAVWAVLALILMDWARVGRQLLFLLGFALTGYAFRKLMVKLSERDRWHVGLMALAAYGWAADWAGLHFMVGAFLAGVILDGNWFNQTQMDLLRHHLLLVVMPVFFLSTGLKTHWSLDNWGVLVAAAALLFASVTGKLFATQWAGYLLNWPKPERSLIGWLLQTKALIMIIFANVLLDKAIISSETFVALLFMAIASTMLTVPVVTPKLARLNRSAKQDAIR